MCEVLGSDECKWSLRLLTVSSVVLKEMTPLKPPVVINSCISRVTCMEKYVPCVKRHQKGNGLLLNMYFGRVPDSLQNDHLTIILCTCLFCRYHFYMYSFTRGGASVSSSDNSCQEEAALQYISTCYINWLVFSSLLPSST